jgi:cysteine desulfuration protein SufE
MFHERVATIRALFEGCPTPQESYERLIQLGREAQPLSSHFKTAANRVTGCQSTLHLHAELIDGLLHFQAEADALISNGLAALMVSIYSGLPPELIVRHPPTFLRELGLSESLSITRLQGAASIYRAMQLRAAQLISL